MGRECFACWGKKSLQNEFTACKMYEQSHKINTFSSYTLAFFEEGHRFGTAAAAGLFEQRAPNTFYMAAPKSTALKPDCEERKQV